MIGRRSNSAWLVSAVCAGAVSLVSGTASAQVQPPPPVWADATADLLASLPPRRHPFPQVDWVDLDAVAAAEETNEAPYEAVHQPLVPEQPVFNAELNRILIADPVGPLILRREAFPSVDYVQLSPEDNSPATPEIPVVESVPVVAPFPESVPVVESVPVAGTVDAPSEPATEEFAQDEAVAMIWRDIESFGPAAKTDEVIVEEPTPATEQKDLETQEAPPKKSRNKVEIPVIDEPLKDDILDERFMVADAVLADVAKTEYLEDLGLLASSDSVDYDEVTEEIAENGLALLEDGSEPDATSRNSLFEVELGEYSNPVITLEEILELALANNPEVGAALSREEQAQWLHRESQAYRYPNVDVVAQGGPEYNRPATNTNDIEDITPGRNLTLRVTQLLYDGGTSVHESERRMQVRRSTEFETRLIVEEIVTATAEFYAQVLQHQRASLVAEEFVTEMLEIVDKLEVMYESGAASKLELDFAKARLASARAETGNTQAQLNDALSNLEFLTGELPDFTAVPPRDIHALNVATLIEYIDLARKQNAAVLLNQSNKQALRYKIRAQRGTFAPIVSLDLKSESLADEGGNLEGRNTTEVKLKAEYFLFDGGVRRARLNRTKAQLKELDWEDERLYKEVDRLVKQAYNQITTNKLTLDATQDEIVSNQELRRLNRQNLEEGEISIIELIEVEERLFNSQATWYRVSAEMFTNYYELLVSAGELASLVGTEFTESRIDDKP